MTSGRTLLLLSFHRIFYQQQHENDTARTMSSRDAINARIENNKKWVARAGRYKKQADGKVKKCREALAEAEERAKVARKDLEDARFALKHAQKAIVAIDSDDEDTTAGSKKRDHACFDSDDKSSGADWKSRRVPEKVLIEGCEQHKVNGIYKLDRFDDRGYPTYLKDCGCELYRIRGYGCSWCISHKRKGSEVRFDVVIYYSLAFRKDPVHWLFTTGWESFFDDEKTALKVLRVDSRADGEP
jgi:hypothetical protein